MKKGFSLILDDTPGQTNNLSLDLLTLNIAAVSICALYSAYVQIEITRIKTRIKGLQFNKSALGTKRNKKLRVANKTNEQVKKVTVAISQLETVESTLEQRRNFSGLASACLALLLIYTSKYNSSRESLSDPEVGNVYAETRKSQSGSTDITIDFGGFIVTNTYTDEQLRNGVPLNFPIKANKITPIDFKIIKNQILVSTDIHDSNGRLIATIKDNEWRTYTKRGFKKNYDAHAFEIVDDEDRPYLQIQYDQNKLKIYGVFWTDDDVVVLTKDGMYSSGILPFSDPEAQKKDLQKKIEDKISKQPAIFIYEGADYIGKRKK